MTAVVLQLQPIHRIKNPPIQRLTSVPFLLVHVIAIVGPILTGVTWKSFGICVVLYYARILAITAGYHRYFSHSTYKLPNWAAFVLAFIGTSAAQKGPLWWTSTHIQHHRYADTDRDPHSPRHGFWWSHMWWILSADSKATDMRIHRVRELAEKPGIAWLDKYNWAAPWILGFAVWLFAGWTGLMLGFFTSTVLCWHGTFLVNSGAHVWGKKKYSLNNTSRNCWWQLPINLGEGSYHDKHHNSPSSVTVTTEWWEIDPTYQMIRLFERFNIAHALEPIPERLLDDDGRMVPRPLSERQLQPA